jgi:hypothetical protein
MIIDKDLPIFVTPKGVKYLSSLRDSALLIAYFFYNNSNPSDFNRVLAGALNQDCPSASSG